MLAYAAVVSKVHVEACSEYLYHDSFGFRMVRLLFYTVGTLLRYSDVAWV